MEMLLGYTGKAHFPCRFQVPLWFEGIFSSGVNQFSLSSIKRIWSYIPPVTLAMMGLPTNKASVKLKPHPSLDVSWI